MNAKLEAEILNVREDLFSQIAEIKSSKDENEKLILEFHKEKVISAKNCKWGLHDNRVNVIVMSIPCSRIRRRFMLETQ